MAEEKESLNGVPLDLTPLIPEILPAGQVGQIVVRVILHEDGKVSPFIQQSFGRVTAGQVGFAIGIAANTVARLSRESRISAGQHLGEEAVAEFNHGVTAGLAYGLEIGAGRSVSEVEEGWQPE